MASILPLELANVRLAIGATLVAEDFTLTLAAGAPTIL
jgi:hypothetical protein